MHPALCSHSVCSHRIGSIVRIQVDGTWAQVRAPRSPGKCMGPSSGAFASEGLHFLRMTAAVRSLRANLAARDENLLQIFEDEYRELRPDASIPELKVEFFAFTIIKNTMAMFLLVQESSCGVRRQLSFLSQLRVVHVRIRPLRDEAEERRRSISRLRDSGQHGRVRTEGGAFSCRAASSRDTSSASSTIRTIPLRCELRKSIHRSPNSMRSDARATLDSSDLLGPRRGLRDDRELVDYVPARQRDRRAVRRRAGEFPCDLFDRDVADLRPR